MLALEQAAFRARELDRPRHAHPKRLARYGWKAYSQTDEDGMIAEIFRRVGTATRCFVEIGVGSGLECNTLWPLLQGWTGLWIEPDKSHCAAIRATHAEWLNRGALRLLGIAATAENVDALLAEAGLAGEIDLLSIDTDFNDYWIWQALEAVRPRAVVIEYNAAWPPPAAVTVPYDPGARWGGTSYFGASLSALAALGARKGYQLVGCNLAGFNAFFVRADLEGGLFLDPGSAESHYEPPRYFLSPLLGGHPAAVGPLVAVEGTSQPG